MATIPDSIKAQLDADWTAAGGVEPTYFVSEDFRTNPPLGTDGLWIPTETLKTDVRPVNDTYANHNHTIDLIVNTIEDEDRLKELADEVVRILNATAIASMTYQRITNRKRVSGDYNGIWVYQEIITVDMREQMATSASAYGAGATGDFTITGDLIVGGDDIKDSGSNIVLSFDGAGAIDAMGTVSMTNLISSVGSNKGFKTGTASNLWLRHNGTDGYLNNGTGALIFQNTGTTIDFLPSNDSDDYIRFSTTANIPKIDCVGGSDLVLETDTNTIGVDQIAALNMFGSANAAWVPCAAMGGNLHSYYQISAGYTTNLGADDFSVDYVLALPTNKGSLKLYLKSLKYSLVDADGDDYITSVGIYGMNNQTRTTLDSDASNHTTVGVKTFAGTTIPAGVIDTSTYQTVYITITIFSTNAADIDMTNVLMECYYA